jgi:hypothetical protein
MTRWWILTGGKRCPRVLRCVNTAGAKPLSTEDRRVAGWGVPPYMLPCGSARTRNLKPSEPKFSDSKMCRPQAPRAR